MISRYLASGFFLFLVLSSTLYGQEFCSPYSNSRVAEADGMSIHYRIWESPSSAPLQGVFLVHGFGASTFSWQQVADSLQQLGYLVVAVDVPPFGYSDRSPRQNQAVTARALLFQQMLQQEFPGYRWHLAGHSMGGGIVQAMALMFPENVMSLTLVSATLFAQIQPGSKEVPLMLKIPGFTSVMGSLAENWFITRGRVASLLESAFGQQPMPWQVDEYLQPLRIPGTARVILNSLRDLEELRELNARQLKVPAIAIWGSDDTWVPLSRHQKLLASLGIPLFLIQEAAHNPHETHFREFMEIMLEFLQEQN